ncbi:MAG: T9SS type A sorting domain-containing protein, partial [Bacteroidota bacterium]
YTIPATIGTIPVDLSNLEILAFVAETSNKIINVNEVPITFSGFTTVNNAQLVSINSIEDVCVGSIEPKFRLSNQGSSPITAATISYAVNGGTPSVYNWSGNLNPLGTTDVTLPLTTFTVSPSNTLDISVVDVNGGNDDDPSNNASNTTFAATTSNSPTVNLTLNLTQDRYGSEITWEFLDGSGNTLANGGPYADLPANGTLLNVENVVVPATGCYRFVIYDSYGDGINSGYGVGSVNIKDGYGNTIYSNNGTYTSQASRNFEVSGNTNTTALQENIHLASMNLFPNPAAAESRLGFELRSTQEVAVRVINALGQTISNTSLGRLSSGNHQHLLDVSALSAGLYTVELRTGDRTSSLRLTVGQ